MGSTRLPGKVMLPLAGEHVLTHDIRRVTAAEDVDEVIVATSEKTADDIVAQYAERAGASVFRGSESNVLGRMFGAASDANAEIVVRITGDCPLVDPDTIDTVIDHINSGNFDYASNTFDRTFPRGLDVEAFTFESFQQVHKEVTDPHYREHVTPYFHEQTNAFNTASVTSDTVFKESPFQDRGDLRLTLDEADDYEVLRAIYKNVSFDDILPIRDAIRYTDENNLMSMNENIRQKAE